MGSFYKRLSYSFGNEDWEMERKALQIHPDSTVLAITASGDRPLNLLVDPCAQMTAIDANPIQNALLDLKTQALKELNHEQFLQFLGARESDCRESMFALFAEDLQPQSQKYWEKNPSLLHEGILYEGMTEKTLQWVSKAFRLLRGKKIEQLFSFSDLDEQNEFVTSEWDTTTWRIFIHTLLHPWITRPLFGDPGLYERKGDGIHIGQFLYQRMTASLYRHLANTNPLLSLVFLGKALPEAYPPYMQEELGASIQRHLDRLSFENTDLLSYLEKAPNHSIDRFSFSDVASYISQEEFERVLKEMVRVARPNARFCVRQTLARHTVPEELTHHFVREEALEKALQEQERCFVYSFCVGTIEKDD